MNVYTKSSSKSGVWTMLSLSDSILHEESSSAHEAILLDKAGKVAKKSIFELFLSGLGPFFLGATFLAALLPFSSNQYFELSSSFLCGLFLTLFLNKKGVQSLLPISESPPQESQLVIPEKKESETQVLTREKKGGEQSIQYVQLRKQFDEKNQVLSQTRKQLFYLETKLLTLEKTHEEGALQEVVYFQEITKYLAQIQRLNEEVALLSDIITTLLAQKKTGVGRPRKVKVKVVEEDLLSSI